MGYGIFVGEIKGIWDIDNRFFGDIDWENCYYLKLKFIGYSVLKLKIDGLWDICGK